MLCLRIYPVCKQFDRTFHQHHIGCCVFGVSSYIKLCAGYLNIQSPGIDDKGV